MPPRLPRLTLYTGGKECSLCEVFKVELDKIRRTHPFELEYWNIRDPPAGTNEREGKKWRRLYQYDIPVLHLEGKRVQKHRIDAPALREVLERWHKSNVDGDTGTADQTADKAAEAGATSKSTSTTSSVVQPTSSRSAFKPYISVLDTITSVASPSPSFSSAKRRMRSSTSPSAQERRSPPKRLPPWRNALGRAYFVLHPDFDASGSAAAAQIAAGEEATYRILLERAFADFSDIPVGSDVPIDNLQDTLDVIVDSEPKRFSFPGEVTTTYDTDAVPLKSKHGGKGRGKAVQIDRTCWNCGGDDHNMPDCPRPRNHQRIDKARRDFMQQKEVARLTMPECHRLYLDSYVCTSDDRKRRLKRASQLRPNNLSSKLLDAIFFVEPADPDEVVDRNGLTPEQYRRFKEDAYVNVRRRRGEMPWFEQMMRWGYPPGWIAQRDPIDEAKRRIRIDPLTEEVESDSDDELLEVFGDFAPTPRQSSAPGSSSPSPPPPPPEPHVAPPPPPAMERPYRKWWELPPPPRNTPALHPRRWVAYKTDLFDWRRLHPYDPVRPMPMPLTMRF